MRLDVDIAVQAGDVPHEFEFAHEGPTLGVFGASGAGKTTLLHAVAGLIRPVRGRIVAGGRVLYDHNERIDLPAHRRRVAMVFQDDRLFPHLNVRDNLRFGERYASGDTRRVTLDEVVGLLELDSLLARRPSSLSGGERRRVAIGRALLSCPALLLLDEPTAGLDERLRAQLLPYLRRLASVGVPLVMVSHDLDELLGVTPTLALVNAGRIVGVGGYRDLVHELGRAMPGPVNVFGETVAGVGKGTVTLRTGSAEFVSLGSGEKGDRVVAHVRAEDVALAGRPIEGVSIRNQLAGTVVRWSASGDGVVVELDVGVPLLAEISGESFGRLGLGEGAPVVALIKASSIHFDRDGSA